MQAQQPQSRATLADYLHLEQTSEARHEFHDGQIYAMAGGSARHAAIQRNLIVALHTRLRTQACSVFGSDLRLAVPDYQGYYYPDAIVVCGALEYDQGFSNSVINPCLIVEILSPSTERFDRGKKFQRYRALTSFQDYLLISQDEIGIDHYQRQADQWLLTSYAQQVQATLVLPNLNLVIPLSEVYEGVTWTEDENPSTASADEAP